MGDLLGAHAVHIYLSVHGSHGSLVNGTVQLGEDLGQSGIRLDQIGIYEVYSVVGGKKPRSSSRVVSPSLESRASVAKASTTSTSSFSMAV